MKNFITKTVCVLLLLVLGVWNVNAQSLPKGQSDATSRIPASEYRGNVGVITPVAINSMQSNVSVFQSSLERAPNTVAYAINCYPDDNVSYNVPLNNPTGSTVIGGALPELPGGGDYVNGVWYAVAPNSTSIYTINPANGQHTVVANHTITTPLGMAYNPSNDKVYIKNSTQFYTVDLQTGASTLAFTADKSLSCFTITNEGRFIALDLTSDYIVEVNSSTGVTTNLFACGMDANFIQDMAIDRETNTIYWAACGSSMQLYSFNEGLTGLTLIGTLPGEMVAFAIPTSATPPVSYDPPVNVQAAVSGSNVSVNWEHPSTSIITHCTGTWSNAFGVAAAYLPANYTLISRWTPSELADAGILEGNKLTKIQYMPHSITGMTFTIKVYQGSTVETDPGTELASETVTTSVVGQVWNTLVLSNPITIDPTKELWFGVEVYQTVASNYAGAFDAQTNGAEHNRVKWIDGVWKKMTDVGAAYIGNLMLKGSIIDANGKSVTLNTTKEDDRGAVVKNYRIYCDNALVGVTGATSFTHANVSAGNHTYCVSAVYVGNMESDKACAAPIMIDNPNPPVQPTSCSDGRIMSYTQGFNATTIPTCWTQEYVTGTTAWTFVTAATGSPATAHSGTHKARFYRASSTANVAKLVSPMLNLGCSDAATLSFWHTQAVWVTDQDQLRVYYRTSETGAWTLIPEAVYTTSVTAWTQRTITLPNVNGTYYIAFEATGVYGYGVQLDDVTISSSGTVIPSSVPGATAVTAAMPHTPNWYTVNLAWTAPDVVTNLVGYNVYRDGLKVSGNTPLTETAFSDVAPYAGSFTYAVEAVWNSGCPSARATKTITMDISPCDIPIISFPFVQGFESGSLPMCWKQQIVKGNANVYWEFVTASTGRPATAHAGSYKARYYYDDQLEQACKLITPMFDLSGGAATLSFWYTQEKWLQGQDNLRIYYKTSEVGEWIMIGEYTESIAAWTQVIIPLPNPGASYWIAFEGDAKEGYGVQLDDIRVDGCAIIDQLPYSEGFEVSGPLNMFPGCWEQENITGNLNWMTFGTGGTPAAPHSGAYKAVFAGNNYDPHVTRLEGPKFALGSNFDYLDFSYWHTQASYAGDIDQLRVYCQKSEDGDWEKVGEYTAAIAAWMQHKHFLSGGSYLRFAFEGTNKYGYGVYVDDIKIAACNNIKDFPYTEGFNTVAATSGSVLPMDCWVNDGGTTNTPWKYVTAGTYPTVTSHSAPGMIQFNSFSSPYTAGTKGRLTTPPIVSPTGEKYMEVSFWMYRDNGYPSNADKINLYVTATRDIGTATPKLTIDRRIGQTPIVTANGWYQYSVIVNAMPTFFVTLEGVSAYGNNMYIDDITVKPYVCTPQDLNIVESFENPDFFPPLCWTNGATPATAVWKKVATGTSPTCTPQDGGNMLQYNCYSYGSGQKGTITTRAFNTGSANQMLVFWMYRDAGYLTSADLVNVYLTADGNIAGKTPITTVNRSTTRPPVVPAAGWYRYIVDLQCASMPVAFVTFEGVSGYGNNIYVDNIEIGDICFPAENVMAELYGDAYPYNHTHVTWGAPNPATASLSGYKIYRNGTLISTITNIITFEYNDETNLALGSYVYCVEATYNNACGKAPQTCAEQVVVVAPGPCDAPENLIAVSHTDDWYDVDLKWEDPTLVGNISYALSDPQGAIGASGDFAIGIRFTPADLVGYGGKPLSQVSFAPNETAISYAIKIYQGGGDFNPGTLVRSQTVSAANLNIGYIWNTVRLTSPVTIDATKDLWIVIEYVGSTGYPAGRDSGPIVKEGYSNLTYYQGTWTTAYALNSALTQNWCLRGIITETGVNPILGYNVRRDDQLLTNTPIQATTYRDRVPGAGTYNYDVSAIYSGTYCESATPAHISVVMDQSPCESIWGLPITESFDGEKFAPWCWESVSATTTPWRRVTTGGSPSCLNHSGAGMIQFNSYSYTSTRRGALITPIFAAEEDCTLKFWIYRDPSYASSADRVIVYINSVPSTVGATTLLTVNRAIALAPTVTEAGWYEYKVILPTAAMAASYVILEGVSGWGSNIYVDDISIVNERACDPIHDVMVTQPSEGTVHITWTAPLNEGLTGYRVTRNGVIVAAHITETTFTDYVSVGAHQYCITALFNKPECTESTPVCFQVDVIPQCDPVLNVTAQVVAANTVRVNWTAATALGVQNYTLYRNDEFVITTTATTYLDEGLDAGSYGYSVVVNYNKSCTMSDPAFSNYVKVEYCVAATNVQATATYDDVTVTWDYTGGPGFNEILLSESFNSGISSTWKNLDKDGDGFTWTPSSTGGYQGGCVLSESYWFIFALTPDNWLISPQVTLTGSETLEYWVKTQDPAWPAEHYGVYVSTTGTSYEDFTPAFEETLTSAEDSWTKRTVDLSAYSGKVYLAFRHYNCSDMFQMMIDEVKIISVWGAPSFDVYKESEFLTNTSSTMYVDTNVVEGADYTYCVRPVYTGCSVDFACANVTVPECTPVPVTNAYAEGNQDTKEVTLTWSYEGTGASFEIYRDHVLVGTTTSLEYKEIVSAYDIIYTYCVKPITTICPNGAESCATVLILKPQEGVNEGDLTVMTIFPNPANTEVTIKNGNVVQVEVFNAVGQLIENIIATEGENISSISVSAYEPGAYMFKIHSADKSIITKPVMVTR